MTKAKDLLAAAAFVLVLVVAPLILVSMAPEPEPGYYVAVVFVDKPTYANDEADPFMYFKVGKVGVTAVELRPDDEVPVAVVYFSSKNVLKLRWDEVGGWEEKPLP